MIESLILGISFITLLVDPHFSRAPSLNQRDSLLLVKN